MTTKSLSLSSAAAGALLALFTATSQAETSPWYLGVAQSIAYDSNLYRLGDGVVLPTSVQSKSDTMSTTSLIAGLDQPWGRQRITGSGALRANRFRENDRLNYNGWELGLGLDWSTIERLSGKLSVNSNRTLRQFDPAFSGNLTERTVEDNNAVTGTVRVGGVTRLSGEATLSRRTVRFSQAAYSGSEYDQNVGSVGLRYRLGGATTVGLGWREARVRYITGTDPYRRRDIDLSASWVPSALTDVYARVSHSRTRHEQRADRDFSGATGELRASTQASGKLKLSARLSRDTGQSYSTFDYQGFVGSTEFNRTTDALRLGADYAFSAKITFDASVEHARRDLNRSLTNLTLDGRSNTTSLSLGARWTPLRAVLTGCNISATQGRTAGGTALIGKDYSSNGLSCFGQFVLQ